jgi:hypothetical protein
VTLILIYKLVTLNLGGARHHTWRECSMHASVPDPYAPGMHQFLMRMLSILCALKGLRYVHTLVPEAYAQCTHQFLTRMLSARISSWLVCSSHASVPDSYAQRTHQFLTRMLSVRISSWRARWACAYADPYAQPAHKGRSICVRNSKFSIIFKKYR